MSILRQPVKKAQRRLWLNRWLAALGWLVAGAAAIFTSLVLVDRLWIGFGAQHEVTSWVTLGLAGLVLITASIWAAVTRESTSSAAMHLDRAARLKERLSTAIYCENLPDPFAKAVVADAERMSRTIIVPQHMPIRVPRSANYAGATCVVAMLFFWLFPSLDLSGNQEKRTEERKQAERVARVQAEVKPIIQQQIKQLGEKNPALKSELEELKPMEAARLETPLDVRREAIKQVEKLNDKLEGKKNSAELSKVEDLKRILRQLAAQKQANTPVGDLAKALSKNDFKAAQDALEQIKSELAKMPATPEEKQKADELKQQLDQLASKLDQLSKDEKRLSEELAKANLNKDEIKRALENLSKKDLDAVKQMMENKGLSQKQIEQMMQKVQSQCAAGAAAKQMSQNLAKAGAKGQGTGQMSDEAKEGLTAGGEQLSEMESMQQELNQINSSMADLKSLKDKLGQGCSSCNGTGMKDGKPCGACNGTGMKPGGQEGAPGGGMGELGEGEGGYAPRQATPFKTVEQKTPVKTLPGRIISQQFVDGEQYKGGVSPGYVEASLASEREVTDAIAREKIPRMYHSGIKKYFDPSSEGLPTNKAAAPEATGGGGATDTTDKNK